MPTPPSLRALVHAEIFREGRPATKGTIQCHSTMEGNYWSSANKRHVRSQRFLCLMDFMGPCCFFLNKCSAFKTNTNLHVHFQLGVAFFLKDNQSYGYRVTLKFLGNEGIRSSQGEKTKWCFNKSPQVPVHINGNSSLRSTEQNPMWQKCQSHHWILSHCHWPKK